MRAVPAPDATTALVGFARALRSCGVDAGTDRLQAFLSALDRLTPSVRSHVYWAGRLTMCGSQDDIDRYDRVFAAYFDRQHPPGRAPRTAPPPCWT